MTTKLHKYQVLVPEDCIGGTLAELNRLGAWPEGRLEREGERIAVNVSISIPAMARFEKWLEEFSQRRGTVVSVSEPG